jgi:alpha-1,6-mannosyltransferase
VTGPVFERPTPVSDPVSVRPAGADPSLVIPLMGGFAAILAICVGATLAGSPFDVHLPGAWAFGMHHTGPGMRNLGKAGVFVGTAALLLAWYQIILYLRHRPTTPVRTVLVVFGVWAIPLLVAPPLFSADAYSYVAQGTMVGAGINPYHYGPVVLTVLDPRVVSLVSPIWLQTAVPYGPFFLGLEAAVVEAARHHESTAIVGLRLLALGGVLLAAAAIPSLARRWGTPPSLAVALVALNPLTLLGLISPDHNDALMAGLVLGAVALLFRGRPALAIGVCALAAAVKAPALIATAFVAWQWAGQHTSWRGRIRTVAAASAITLAVLEVFGLVTRVGWGWVTTLGTPGVVRSVVTPTTDVALLGEWFVRIVKFGPSTATLLAASRAGGYLAVAGITAWLLWRSQRWGTMLTLAISLLVVVALGPVFQPWYLAWGLFCLAPIAVGRWQVLLIAVSTFAAVATLPRFEPLVASTGLAGDVFGLVALVGLASLASPRVIAKLAALPARIQARKSP